MLDQIEILMGEAEGYMEQDWSQPYLAYRTCSRILELDSESEDVSRRVSLIAYPALVHMIDSQVDSALREAQDGFTTSMEDHIENAKRYSKELGTKVNRRTITNMRRMGYERGFNQNIRCAIEYARSGEDVPVNISLENAESDYRRLQRFNDAPEIDFGAKAEKIRSSLRRHS